jgi:hypothetical protein
MLSDYGADVIKVERAAGGDPGRALRAADGYQYLNPIIESVIDAGGVLVATDLPSFRQLQSLAVCWNVPVYSDALPCDDLTVAHG